MTLGIRILNEVISGTIELSLIFDAMTGFMKALDGYISIYSSSSNGNLLMSLLLGL